MKSKLLHLRIYGEARLLVENIVGALSRILADADAPEC